MKSNIEQNIKESLQNHEMPYNASAWTAMQAKLDVVKPVSVSAPVSSLKWIIVAASVAVVGIIGYVAMSSNTEPIKKEPIQAQTNKVNESNNSITKENIVDDNKTVENNTIPTPSNNDNLSSTNNSSNPQLNPKNKSTNDEINTVVNTNNVNSDNNSNNTADSNNNNESNNNVVVNNTSKNYILPKVSDVCEGDLVTIKNTNDVPVLVEGSDISVIIPANSERKIKMTGNGSHTISVVTNEKTNKTAVFNVKSLPNADFLIDTDTKFEKGLPTTKLETTSIGVEYTWIVGKSRIHGEKINTHFYTPGNHKVTLLVKDVNGCTTSATKTVQIESKYNLMAVNSFIPEDADRRNNTFMPFALTQRDVKFNLIILDPTDGHTVFQSNDASNAWDGIDKSNGNPVNYGATYIWKVTIENAELNENNEYAGNITPIRKR